ncbi:MULTISPECIES: hypothetical protein [Bradyrhizobium]|uniref:hypothetical protein n=1 Tax=Bradyrhizobium TaxID=374 RepID=UPI0012FE7178|nr:hypothetical protein [Bradyrhizobium elkanii]MBP2433887.1 hypothetical protein [Bradyrhizobium elkanii]MBR1159956.1 hypothetical protein [Bradyrhizobium elkanii]WLA85676.1 hypothetical protein QNJ99_16450 [Bradyrhizobium elkanii]WLA89131.1 hypothetical protein QNJ96_29240 [Bradyrhizobium elkanii]
MPLRQHPGFAAVPFYREKYANGWERFASAAVDDLLKRTQSTSPKAPARFPGCAGANYCAIVPGRGEQESAPIARLALKGC